MTSTILGLPLEDATPGHYTVRDGGTGAYKTRPRMYAQFPVRWQFGVGDYLNTGTWKSSADATIPYYAPATETAGNASNSNPVDEFENLSFIVPPGWKIRSLNGSVRANNAEITDFEIVIAAVEATSDAITDGFKNADADQSYTELGRWQFSIDKPAGALNTSGYLVYVDFGDLNYEWVRRGGLVAYARNMTATPVTANRYVSYGAIAEFEV